MAYLRACQWSWRKRHWSMAYRGGHLRAGSRPISSENGPLGVERTGAIAATTRGADSVQEKQEVTKPYLQVDYSWRQDASTNALQRATRDGWRVYDAPRSN